MLTAERVNSPYKAYARNLSGTTYLEVERGTSISFHDEKWSIVYPVQETKSVSKSEKELFAIFFNLYKSVSENRAQFESNQLSETYVTDCFIKVLGYVKAIGAEQFEFYFTKDLTFRCTFNFKNIPVYLEYYLDSDPKDIEDDELIITLDRDSDTIKSYGGALKDVFFALINEVMDTP